MKDEKLIIGLSNFLFGHEKNSTKYVCDAFRFNHPGTPCGRQAQLPGGVAARAVYIWSCRAKVDGAAGAATSALYRATMHGATQAFGRARAIDAAKSVSLKKTDSVRFKIIFKKG